MSKIDLENTPIDEHSEAWDALDRRLLEWMGFEVIAAGYKVSAAGPDVAPQYECISGEEGLVMVIPSPSRTWDGFEKLVSELENRGIFWMVNRRKSGYVAALGDGPIDAEHAEPRMALALAVDKLPDGGRVSE